MQSSSKKSIVLKMKVVLRRFRVLTEFLHSADLFFIFTLFHSAGPFYIFTFTLHFTFLHHICFSLAFLNAQKMWNNSCREWTWTEKAGLHCLKHPDALSGRLDFSTFAHLLCQRASSTSPMFGRQDHLHKIQVLCQLNRTSRGLGRLFHKGRGPLWTTKLLTL